MTGTATDASSIDVVGSLEHLTGRAVGAVTWLAGQSVELRLAEDGSLHAGRPGDDRQGVLVARLQAVGGTFALEVGDGHKVWVNGKPVGSRVLRDGDLIEIEEYGPLSRLRLHHQDAAPARSVGEILLDALAYLRASRQPWPRRCYRASRILASRLAWQTTVWFRSLVTVAIAVLIVLTYQQYRVNVRQEARIDQGFARLESVSAALARAQQEALRAADLAVFRQEARARLSELERQSSAVSTVIAEAAESVGFIQGAYAFRQISDGSMLRHVVDEGGRPLVSPLGRPLLTTEGDGPVAELQFTGTGFLLADEAAIVTNRHIARPWEMETGTAVLAQGGLEPVMTRFVIYFPNHVRPFDLESERASEGADLAILRLLRAPPDVAGLVLAQELPPAGEDVVVLGYPTGLRSMIAQSGSEFLDELAQAGDVDFWTVARKLAERNMISPLASRGIVGRHSPTAVVYDAETTSGGSGGPVLDTRGKVVAVNTAILPEYGGSNIGVPVSLLRDLLER